MREINNLLKQLPDMIGRNWRIKCSKNKEKIKRRKPVEHSSTHSYYADWFETSKVEADCTAHVLESFDVTGASCGLWFVSDFCCTVLSVGLSLDEFESSSSSLEDSPLLLLNVSKEGLNRSQMSTSFCGKNNKNKHFAR